MDTQEEPKNYASFVVIVEWEDFPSSDDSVESACHELNKALAGLPGGVSTRPLSEVIAC